MIMKSFACLLILLGLCIDIMALPIFVILMPIFKALKPEIPCTDGHCVFIWSDFLSNDSSLFWFPFCFGLFCIGFGVLIIFYENKD